MKESLPSDERYYRLLPNPPSSKSPFILPRDPEPIRTRTACFAPWEEHIHPGGLLYYTQIIEGMHRSRRLVTDYPLRLPGRAQLAEAHLLNIYRSGVIPLEGIWEMCLVISDDSLETGYYMADHATRKIFFLRDVDPDQVEGLDFPNDDVSKEAVAGLRLEVEYWRHVLNFPSHFALAEELTVELSSIMSFYDIDNMLSDFSTFPCSHERLDSLQNAWERVRDLKPTSLAVRANRNWIAARLFFYFTNNRLFNNYGTEFARMERLYPGRTTRLEEENNNWMVDMFCWAFMFNEPDEVFRVVKQVWIGEFVSDESWTPMMETFRVEWDRISTFSALILVGALGALAVPIADDIWVNNSYIAGAAKFGTALAILSCLYVLGSVVSVFVLKRYFSGRIMTVHDPSVQASYLRRLNRGPLGVFVLAVVLSLPTVLLQWSIIFLLMALLGLAAAWQSTHLVAFWVVCGVFSLMCLGLGSAMLLAYPGKDLDPPR